MPIYVFRCSACGEQFERRLTVAEREQGTLACPACHAVTIEPVLSSFFAKTSRKS
jgi:putative FmdB family regulatory protein